MKGSTRGGGLGQDSIMVICSSPNGRGIHQYAKTLHANISESVLISCPWMPGYYLLWELLGIAFSGSKIWEASHVVFCNTRISPLLWPLLRRDKVTVVVHDLMDTSQGSDQDIDRMNPFRWIKVKANTILIRQSVERAGRVISNSAYTRSRLTAWLESSCPPVHVLHPPPSFEAVDAERRINLVKSVKSRAEDVINVLAVAGVTANKSLPDYFTWHQEVSRLTSRPIRLTLYGVRFSDLSLGQRDYVVEMAGLISLEYKRDQDVLLQDYLKCDFLISLSREEGFGIPVADAIGFGIRVIARNIKAYEEQQSGLDGASVLRLGRDVYECCMKTIDIIGETRELGPAYYLPEARLSRYADYIQRYQVRSKVTIHNVLTRGSFE